MPDIVEKGVAAAQYSACVDKMRDNVEGGTKWETKARRIRTRVRNRRKLKRTKRQKRSRISKKAQHSERMMMCPRQLLSGKTGM